MSVEPRCPLCGADRSRLRYRIPRFRVHRCLACEVVYLWPQIDDDTVRRLFEAFYAGDVSALPELGDYYQHTFHDTPGNPLVESCETWLDAIERVRPPGRLLDVGCGSGLFLAVARRRGWEPTGVDDCAVATRHAREHFGLEVWDGCFDDLASRARGRFDAVTMWDVIEHARSPVSLLASARDALAPGGVVGLATPNRRSLLELVAGGLYRASAGRVTGPLEKLYIDQHFLYFDPATLRDAFARARLEPLRIDRESTDLRRLSLPPATRAGLRLLFAAARLVGWENRLFALARAGD